MHDVNKDMDYLESCLHAAPFTPIPWDGEDKNLAAFRSKEEMVAWYSQGPGVDGEPYRDRGFYCRELAMLSRIIQPVTIVELGTSLGIGTCLLCWLNSYWSEPRARLVTVDNKDFTYMPGDQKVVMGRIARLQNIECEYKLMESWDYEQPGVQLTFIDANHSYESVLKDSKQAWQNRAWWDKWAIAWHDYNERHLGVMQAVKEFCNVKGLELQSRSDSDTVWVWGL